MKTIVGIFDSQKDAEGAVNGLDALGLDEGAIHVITRSGVESDNSLLGSFARALSSGSSPVSSELTRLGLSREEADFYEEELGEEGVLVAVKVDDDDSAGAMAAMRDANGVIRE